MEARWKKIEVQRTSQNISCRKYEVGHPGFSKGSPVLQAYERALDDHNPKSIFRKRQLRRNTQSETLPNSKR